MSNFPLWYKNILDAYGFNDKISYADAEWAFESFAQSARVFNIIKLIGKRCGWKFDDHHGLVTIYTGYIREHYVPVYDDTGIWTGHKKLVPTDYGTANQFPYIEICRNGADKFFEYVTDYLNLTREKNLFLLWKLCIDNAPNREFRMLCSFIGM